MDEKHLISLKQNIDDFAKSHMRGRTTQSLLDAGMKEVGYKNAKKNAFSAKLPNFNFDFFADISVTQDKLPTVSLHCLSMMKLELLLVEQRIKAGELEESSDSGSQIASYGKDIGNLNAKMNAWTREMECLHQMVDREIFDYYDQGSDGGRPRYR
ncbi:MAG: hypothetical protein Q9202_006969 [Teloschistes flavicans]